MKVVRTANIEKFMNHLHDFSIKHKGNDYAAEVLMSFVRGECLHLSDGNGRCELCGVKCIQN